MVSVFLGLCSLVGALWILLVVGERRQPSAVDIEALAECGVQLL